MLSFEDVKTYIKDCLVLHLKVTDVSGKKVLELEGLSPEALIIKLEPYVATMSTYGRVNFHGATASQYKQNWKDSYHWPVIFNAAAPGIQQNNTPGIVHHAPGYISQNEATLMAELSKLRLQIDLDKKFAEMKADLEKKIDGTKSKTSETERMIDKYAPFLLPQIGFKMDAEKLKQMEMFAMMSGGGNRQQPTQQNSISGANTGVNSETGAKIELTEKEKQELLAVNDGIDKLTEKVSMEKLIMLIQHLNANPGMVDTAINLINMNNQK